MHDLAVTNKRILSGARRARSASYEDLLELPALAVFSVLFATLLCIPLLPYMQFRKVAVYVKCKPTPVLLVRPYAAIFSSHLFSQLRSYLLNIPLYNSP